MGKVLIRKSSPERKSPGKITLERAPERRVGATRLGLVITVVNNGQAAPIVAIANKADSACSFIAHGAGTAKNDIYNVLGLGELRKQVIFSLVRENKWGVYKNLIEQRFAVSASSKGVSIYLLLDSLCGVSAYRFLSNERPGYKEETAMDEKKADGNEVIFAIVNDGYTDLVMEAAKKAGARGGTVLQARGTGNKEIEKFYGIVITPEKQIVMIIVPKAIKDAVMKSIYKEAGISSKGQGIVFSLPVSDAAGLAKTEPEAKPAEEEKKE
jgi:nitrogen regulatory protein PII